MSNRGFSLTEIGALVGFVAAFGVLLGLVMLLFHAHRARGAKIAAISCFAMVAAFVLRATGELPSNNPSAHVARAECRISLDQYTELVTGMSYADAVNIIGCEGTELSRSEIGGIVAVMYMWQNSSLNGSNMNAMFQDDRLISKAQFGLQ